jgi:hypothetical protein
MSSFFRFLPGVDTSEYHHYFHTDLETPQTVPWTGLEASTRAYAKIIDEVNKLPLSAFPATGRADAGIRPSPDRRGHRRARTTRQLHSANPDGTGAALHQHGPSFDRTRHMNTAVRGDGGDAEACALLERDAVRQRHRLRGGHHRIFRGRAEWAVRLRAVAPDAAADPVGGNAFSNEIDVSCTVAVRDDARVGHAVAERVLSLLDVAWIDARRDHPYA